MTKAIWVFQFHPIRDWLTQDEGSADDDSLISDDEDEMYEGSGFGGVNVGVQLVEDSDFVLTEYGPGAVEACALSLQQTRRNVVFVVTGGKDGSNYRTVARYTVSGEITYLANLLTGRDVHACGSFVNSEGDTVSIY